MTAAITWDPQYTSNALNDITKVYAGFSFKDNGKRVAMPTIYNSDPLAKAKEVLNIVQDYTGMKIGSVSAVLELNHDTTRPEDPGSEPSHEMFKFKALRNGAHVEDNLSLYVPAFICPELDDVQALGELLATTLTEAGVVRVRFVGTTGSRRR